MTYFEVLKKISKRYQAKANDKVIKKFFTEVMKATWRDGRFVIPKFVALNVKTMKTRTIRNPVTQELMQLPAIKTVKARVCKEWRTQ